MKITDEIVGQSDADKGQKLIELLNLRQVKDADGNRYNPPRYNTSYGTKTAIGLYLTIQRIMQEEQ